MFIDEPAVLARLRAAIARLTTEIELRKDLAQEAALHWWLPGYLWQERGSDEEVHRPPRSKFWVYFPAAAASNVQLESYVESRV